jgi:hypothetical protein
MYYELNRGAARTFLRSFGNYCFDLRARLQTQPHQRASDWLASLVGATLPTAGRNIDRAALPRRRGLHPRKAFPALSVRLAPHETQPPTGPPMTLGNMCELGGAHLIGSVSTTHVGHQTLIDVSTCSDDLAVPSFQHESTTAKTGCLVLAPRKLARTRRQLRSAGSTRL